MSKNTGGPAFCTLDNDGMTLRDYFAAKAMQAMLSNPEFPQEFKIPGAAYAVADAMLAEREK